MYAVCFVYDLYSCLFVRLLIFYGSKPVLQYFISLNCLPTLPEGVLKCQFLEDYSKVALYNS
jgi:hypothetical protein